MSTKDRPIIEIYKNGDPYGTGFQATRYENQTEYDTGIGIFMGGLSPMSREQWRRYASQSGAILRQR